ncbi:hypothetical protein INT43_004109 [Umbelopsis isabellina]|uniref:DUF453-domain-containing protein n=1 Tax=Mortierella isabellina TaxID=91625 RepID=A0A8H7PCD6_MORIS|nr:hypothetical protein INT43_004109 [Umbelopsis isabellina]
MSYVPTYCKLISRKHLAKTQDLRCSDSTYNLAHGSDGQYGIPCTYPRGGTSKAVFFHDKHLPVPDPLRDPVLKRVFWTPDTQQIDGMGGTKPIPLGLLLSRHQTVSDADVEYRFAQVGVEKVDIGYIGNCGNISVAVGPFAIDEGLVKDYCAGHSPNGKIPAQEVRIFNNGTEKVLISHVLINPDTGLSISKCALSIDGSPGTSASILMDYRNTTGAAKGNAILPSGRVIDTATINGKDIAINICDVANTSISVKASDMGVIGTESAAELSKNQILITRSPTFTLAATLAERLDSPSRLMKLPLISWSDMKVVTKYDVLQSHHNYFSDIQKILNTIASTLSVSKEIRTYARHLQNYNNLQQCA